MMLLQNRITFLHEDLVFIYLLVRRFADTVGVRKRHGLTG